MLTGKTNFKNRLPPSKNPNTTNYTRTNHKDNHECNLGTIAGAEQLTKFIERIERLEEEKRAIMADIKDVYAEAKATGFEPKVMRQVVRLRNGQ